MSIEALNGVNFAAAVQPEMNPDLRPEPHLHRLHLNDDTDSAAGVGRLLPMIGRVRPV